MNNYKVVIDAFHGGDDVGCLLSNIPEKNITLELSKYMYQKFLSLNIPVSLVRNQDVTIPLKDRIQKITELYGDHKYVILISNHVGIQKNYEIVYGIQNNPQLSYHITSSLLQEKENVACYFKRWGIHPNLDYYKIHRKIANMQVLKITHPFHQNRGYLDKGVDAIVNAVYTFIGGKVEQNLYEVVKGDTLWNVASKFHLSVDELKMLNGFKNNLLRTGDKIKIKQEQKDICYTVGMGENLYQIGQKFHIGIEELMYYNHKKSNLVKVGEIIYIPKKNDVRHTVQEGENLYQIAGIYHVDVDTIVQKNGLNDTQVTVGKKLLIEKTS